MWQYADWIQIDDLSQRLARLRLHITEVSQRVVGTSTRSSAVTATNQGYLNNLMQQEDQLKASVSRPSIARNKLKSR